MKQTRLVLVVVLCCLTLSGLLSQAFGASAAILGWNNLGMHCMDSDYSVFSILPPYNTIEAQLLVGGKLMQSGSGYTVSYEAVADPDGSINSTSIGKGNWGQFANALYGLPASASADNGLAGWSMPGLANVPQRMRFETYNAPASGVSTPVNWFRAEGIPITPIDDKGNKNSYPLMRLVARDAGNTVIAKSDIVLPVSDEMDCSVCHSSGTMAAAQPASGWVFAPTKDRDYRLNIIRLHDEQQFGQNGALYRDALAAKGLDAGGLYATVAAGRPILCAACHASEALGTASFTSSNGSVPPLTSSMHTKHAAVKDPVLNVTLDDATNRNACYRCHPGSATRCLRGAMGSAIATDGSMAMQCQSCHGSMSQVGSSSRVGWFMEPNCQNCHTGTAVKNSGQIRYTSVFDSTGGPRIPADPTFATTPDTPAPGLSLYRFSVGHGGLQCSACHGSTHAEFPSSHRNDNIRNVQLQGHGGVTVECTACHASTPTTANGGPHGMHPVGQSWVSGHHDLISSVGVASCKACHGTDYRGTVLSRMQADRTMSLGDFGTQSFFRGATIGCYTCHQGPSNSGFNSAAAPTVGNVTGAGVAGASVVMTIPVTGVNAVLRIVSQPANGTVGLVNGVATYYPGEGFTGTDTFTFAAYDGAKNSNLGTGTVTIAPGAPVITQNPASVTVAAGSAASFTVAASGSAPLSYQWFKNGSAVAGATTPVLSIPAAGSVDAGSYYAVVSNYAGSATSSAAVLTVTYPAPAITGFTPASGSAGSTVTVNGTNFVGVNSVKFNGTSASFTQVSATQLSATVPQGATTGPVSVTTANGTATSSTSFTVLVSPTITGFTPGYGGVGTAVTVTGSNFTGVTAVKFNGVSAPFTVTSGTTLVTGVPAGATSGKLTVTATGGTATSSSSFSVSGKSVAPRIKSFSPSSGKVGSTITVTGTNLGGMTSARIGGVGAPFAVVSAGKVLLTVPTGAKSGRISVTTAGGTGTSSSNFTVLP
ncbi:IPT/TIG domain-containing protein [Geomonas sp. Red69]|uniref:IPT/TIG domain-containing protein n=1 Tax=Geomonas diazotrophica TaxID=2843197 RepID=UPI001C1209B5|nr:MULTISPECIES: IPT/TIG domain-containing protein [Geomonas]MBU5635303.1 IPT/TIG domain-containing protein [Geomonas diazotrophica]QXE86780.1 IPT/TIG domain-containing protein [Geomonas nitrogeniifigens]